MSIKMLRRSLVILLLCAFLGSMVLSGCARHPGPEELNQLEMTKAAALAAEEKAEAKTKERMEWEAKLKEKQKQLQKAEDDLKAVEDALAAEGK